MTTTTMQRVFIMDEDIFESDCTVIAHQANCFKTMGAGFAKELKTRHPEAVIADLKFPLGTKERLGRCSRTFTGDKSRIIVNLYGQYNYGRKQGEVYTHYKALKTALMEMFQGLDKLEEEDPNFRIKIGIPYGMAAGYAGGDWPRIEKGITALAEKYGRAVYIYKKQ